MDFKQGFKKILQNRRISRLTIVITENKAIAVLSILFLVAGIVIIEYGLDRVTIPVSTEAPDEKSDTETTAPPLPEGDYSADYLAGEVKPDQGLFQAVMDMGISTDAALKVINVLRYNVELIAIRAGEKVWVKLTDGKTGISEFIYEPDSVVDHKVTLDTTTGEYVYSMTEEPTEFRYRVIEGTLEEGSSLNDTLLNSQVPPNLTGTVNGILQCKISFRTDAREGDIFKVLLRERYYGDEWIGGTVMYASYRGKRTGFHEAFRYSEDDPKSSYNAHYTPEGEALIHSGLRYPLDRLFIVSRYGMRVHPITGRRQMHYGVDYRARPGTKVHAVARGKVIVSSYDSISGNKIAIRHDDGSSSWYLHLQKRSVKKGQQVKTRQVIGTSGSTGRVEGPHLHFAFKNAKNQWMNPLKKRMIATPKLEGSRLEQLQAQVKDIRQRLKDIGENDAGPADTVTLTKRVE
ncbi:MAG: peptidoglycan DD-metalloendopeptidase family protein [Sedimentisphaerales bacterium]|nr:peptidoglycan DD-metalloendopeptidase family protein [Sedimentisphaerales bacterium]